VRYSPEDPILDTGGGIKNAEPLLAGEPFVVANGDSLLEIRCATCSSGTGARGGVATLMVRPGPGRRRLRARRARRRRSRPPYRRPAGDARRRDARLHVPRPPRPRARDLPLDGRGRRLQHHAGDVSAHDRGRVARFRVVTQARWITIDTPEALATADRVLRDAPFAV
jgi:hypothetical protein